MKWKTQKKFISLIPIRKVRKHLLSYYIDDQGHNNQVVYIDGDRKIINKPIPGCKIRFLGDNNSVTIYKPSGTLTVKIFVSSGVNIVLHPAWGNFDIEKRAGENTTNQLLIDEGTSAGGLQIRFCHGGGNIHIGKNCMFSWNIEMRTGDYHSVIDAKTKQLLNQNQNIHIGDHVWVGSDALILKGTEIADNSIVGTRSVVTKKFQTPNCIVAGVPARQVKDSVNWDKQTPATYTIE